MIATRIAFNRADEDTPERTVTRRAGPDGTDWSVFILNGHARRFSTEGQGARA